MPSDFGNMSIQERIRAMSQRIDHVDLLEERDPSPEEDEVVVDDATPAKRTFEEQRDPSPEDVEVEEEHPPTKRTSVVNMWRKREASTNISSKETVPARRKMSVLEKWSSAQQKSEAQDKIAEAEEKKEQDGATVPPCKLTVAELIASKSRVPPLLATPTPPPLTPPKKANWVNFDVNSNAEAAPKSQTAPQPQVLPKPQLSITDMITQRALPPVEKKKDQDDAAVSSPGKKLTVAEMIASKSPVLQPVVTVPAVSQKAEHLMDAKSTKEEQPTSQSTAPKPQLSQQASLPPVAIMTVINKPNATIMDEEEDKDLIIVGEDTNVASHKQQLATRGDKWNRLSSAADTAEESGIDLPEERDQAPAMEDEEPTNRSSVVNIWRKREASTNVSSTETSVPGRRKMSVLEKWSSAQQKSEAQEKIAEEKKEQEDGIISPSKLTVAELIASKSQVPVPPAAVPPAPPAAPTVTPKKADWVDFDVTSSRETSPKPQTAPKPQAVPKPQLSITDIVPQRALPPVVKDKDLLITVGNDGDNARKQPSVRDKWNRLSSVADTTAEQRAIHGPEECIQVPVEDDVVEEEEAMQQASVADAWRKHKVASSTHTKTETVPTRRKMNFFEKGSATQQKPQAQDEIDQGERKDDSKSPSKATVAEMIALKSRSVATASPPKKAIAVDTKSKKEGQPKPHPAPKPQLSMAEPNPPAAAKEKEKNLVYVDGDDADDEIARLKQPSKRVADDWNRLSSTAAVHHSDKPAVPPQRQSIADSIWIKRAASSTEEVAGKPQLSVVEPKAKPPAAMEEEKDLVFVGEDDTEADDEEVPRKQPSKRVAGKWNRLSSTAAVHNSDKPAAPPQRQSIADNVWIKRAASPTEEFSAKPQLSIVEPKAKPPAATEDEKDLVFVGEEDEQVPRKEPSKRVAGKCNRLSSTAAEVKSDVLAAPPQRQSVADNVWIKRAASPTQEVAGKPQLSITEPKAKLPTATEEEKDLVLVGEDNAEAVDKDVPHKQSSKRVRGKWSRLSSTAAEDNSDVLAAPPQRQSVADNIWIKRTALREQEGAGNQAESTPVRQLSTEQEEKVVKQQPVIVTPMRSLDTSTRGESKPAWATKSLNRTGSFAPEDLTQSTQDTWAQKTGALSSETSIATTPKPLRKWGDVKSQWASTKPTWTTRSLKSATEPVVDDKPVADIEEETNVAPPASKTAPVRTWGSSKPSSSKPIWATRSLKNTSSFITTVESSEPNVVVKGEDVVTVGEVAVMNEDKPVRKWNVRPQTSSTMERTEAEEGNTIETTTKPVRKWSPPSSIKSFKPVWATRSLKCTGSVSAASVVEASPIVEEEQPAEEKIIESKPEQDRVPCPLLQSESLSGPKPAWATRSLYRTSEVASPEPTGDMPAWANKSSVPQWAKRGWVAHTKSFESPTVSEPVVSSGPLWANRQTMPSPAQVSDMAPQPPTDEANDAPLHKANSSSRVAVDETTETEKKSVQEPTSVASLSQQESPVTPRNTRPFLSKKLGKSPSSIIENSESPSITPVWATVSLRKTGRLPPMIDTSNLDEIATVEMRKNSIAETPKVVSPGAISSLGSSATKSQTSLSPGLISSEASSESSSAGCLSPESSPNKAPSSNHDTNACVSWLELHHGAVVEKKTDIGPRNEVEKEEVPINAPTKVHADPHSAVNGSGVDIAGDTENANKESPTAQTENEKPALRARIASPREMLDLIRATLVNHRRNQVSRGPLRVKHSMSQNNLSNHESLA